jgi:hypothetical protein
MWNPDQPAPPSGDEAVPLDGLPMVTLEWVWNSLGVRYGHYFAGKWDGFDLGIVKEDWRYQLARLTDAQLQYGLDNLPVGRPPSDVQEFRRICLQAPEPKPQHPALPRKRGRLEIPPHVRAKFEQLRPREDEEPSNVRAARGTIANLEPRQGLGDVQKAVLAAARRVVARYEAAHPKDSAATPAV